MNAPHDPRDVSAEAGGAADAIFEANLQALLTRAYAPELPSAEFRARAEAAVLAAMPARRAAGPRAWTLLRPALAAAAALLVGLTVWWWQASAPAPVFSPDRWLAQGLVAVRETPDDEWRGLQPGAPSPLRLGDFLELITPERGEFDVLVPAADHVLARAASHARLTQPPAPAADPRLGADIALTIAWEAGALQLRHADTGSAWRLDTPAGPIVLACGTLDVAYAPSGGGIMTVALRDGSAWLIGRNGRADLPSGASVLLAGGELRPQGGADEAEPGGPAGGLALPQTAARPPEPIVTLSTASAPEPAPPAPRELAGRVTDAVTGAPVATFRLSIVRDRRMDDANLPLTRMVESADGRFAWTGIEPDTWALFVQADGYAVASRTGLLIGAEAALPPLAIALERGAAARGVVVDAASGQPVAGAVVLSQTDVPMRNLPLDADMFPPEVTAFTRTSADGSFELPRLSSGQQVLRATAEGFAPQSTESFPLRAGEAPQGLLIQLRPGASVTGRVTNAAGEPVVRAVLLAWSNGSSGTQASASYGVGLSDEQGRYTITSLPPGDAQVLLLGDEVTQGSRSPLQLQPVHLVGGQVAALDFVGGGIGRLHGRVVDDREQPVTKLSVSVEIKGVSDEEAQATWRGTVTGPDGTWEINDLRLATYEVYVGSPASGSMRAWGDVTLAAAGDMLLDIHLPAGRIAGTVSALADGAALPTVALILEAVEEPAGKADATAFRFAGFAMTGIDGRYAFENVRSGSYRLTAYATAPDAAGVSYGAERSNEIRVQPGLAAGETNLRLGAGGSVAVTVRNVTGEPVAGARVSFKDVAGAEMTFDRDPRTDAAGRYVARGVKPGRWYVVAEKAGLQRAELAVEAQAGAEQPVELVLAPVP